MNMMNMMMIMIMTMMIIPMMNMMMKIEFAITWPIFKLGGPEFAW